MKLSPEQRRAVERAKAAGDHRVGLVFTPEQKREWLAAVEVELAAKEENIALLRKIKSAAEEPGLIGDGRRAAGLSRMRLAELAGLVGVEADLFADFQAGEAQLPPSALDRLLDVLGLRLMREIPR